MYNVYIHISLADWVTLLVLISSGSEGEPSKGNAAVTKSFVSFPLLPGLGMVMWVQWICNVCGWYMWRGGFPKWINTITSSRWLQHLVPLSLIVLMLYWLPLSREQKRACCTVYSFHRDTLAHTCSFIAYSNILTLSQL